MDDADEYRCFVGGLSWGTDERMLEDEFAAYGVKETKVSCSNDVLDFR
jgi:RNA recognition motif-containing protein